MASFAHLSTKDVAVLVHNQTRTNALLRYLNAAPAAKVRLDPKKIKRVDMAVSPSAPGTEGANKFLKFIPPLRYNNPGVSITYTKLEYLSDQELAQKAEDDKAAQQKAAEEARKATERLAAGQDDVDAFEAKPVALGPGLEKAEADRQQQLKEARKKEKLRQKHMQKAAVKAAFQGSGAKPPNRPQVDWPAPVVTDPTPRLTITFVDDSTTMLQCAEQEPERILEQLAASATQDKGESPHA